MYLPSPNRCFEKSLPRSLFYMARDMGIVLALQYVYPLYVAGNWPLTFLWWNATGFMLWALFVIGEREHERREHQLVSGCYVITWTM